MLPVLGRGAFLGKHKNKKMLMASKESSKLVLSNDDAIAALVAASIFVP